jgi:acyl carrier protein
MEKKEIEALVKEFLIEEMEIEADLVTGEARLKEDLGLDSLDFVDIVVIIERIFGFKIKPEEMATVNTVNEFTGYIDSKVNV